MLVSTKLKKKAPSPNPMRQVPLQRPSYNWMITFASWQIVETILQRGEIAISDKHPEDHPIDDHEEEESLAEGENQCGKSDA